MKRIIPKSLIWGSFLLVGLGSFAQSVNPNAPKAEMNLVKVELTVHGLQVHPAIVRPGRVRFLIENQTMIPNPQFILSTVRGSGVQAAKADVAKLERKSSGMSGVTETNLGVGEYTVTLQSAPQLKSQLAVRP
jgi:hypothetical protein